MSTFEFKNSRGTTYFLNTKEVTLKTGTVRQIFFFSKDQRDTGCAMPEGYEVSESKQSGLPLLRKQR